MKPPEKPRLPEKAATSRRLALTDVHVMQRFTIPAWGYLEGIEITPCIELPNMDVAAGPYSVEVVLRDPSGHPVPVDVQAVVRDVKNPV